jgi:hypothetical protein
LKTLHDSLDAPRREELHRAYVDHYDSHQRNGRIEAPREYVIVLGTRR